MLRRPAVVRKPRKGAAVARGTSLPPPVEGWDAVSPISDMSPKRAIVLDNWFPTPQGCMVRRGRAQHATSLGSGVVDSLMPYNGATSAASKLFGAANNNIYDVTTAGAASSVVSGLSNNRWQHTNFRVTGGHYLWCCNGIDDPKHYNGSAWATPSLTISGHTADEIVNVSVHKNRLWVTFKNSLDIGYLATSSISGTVTVFPLGAVMSKGGYIVGTATWTRDGGAGEDDFFAAVSSMGQVAIYQGTDPSSASTWSLVGVYDLGAPIGYRCLTKVAGDLALINLEGVLPLSKGLSQDRGAAAQIAITARINNAMNAAARLYKSNFGWELTPYSRGTMAILNVPITEGLLQHQYVMNTLTGAWCRFKNWNANCFAVFKDELYMGGNDGTVSKCDTGGIDGEDPIDAIGQGAYNYFKTRGQRKDFKLLRAILSTDSNTRPSVGISTDFRDNAVLGTPTAAATEPVLWDNAVWDTDSWPTEGRTVAEWQPVSGEGYCASIHFRSRTGAEEGQGDIEMTLNGFDIMYEESAPGAAL